MYLMYLMIKRFLLYLLLKTRAIISLLPILLLYGAAYRLADLGCRRLTAEYDLQLHVELNGFK